VVAQSCSNSPQTRFFSANCKNVESPVIGSCHLPKPNPHLNLLLNPSCTKCPIFQSSAHLRDAVTVGSPVLVRKLEQLLGVVQKRAGVRRVRSAQRHRSGRQGGGGLSSEVRAGVVLVDLVHRPGGVHGLGTRPAADRRLEWVESMEV
jgi:hypothetical protein